MGGRELIDRRCYKRFSPRSPAFVALGNHGNTIAQIVDICRGGLACHYIADEGRFNQSDCLDIYSAEEQFYLKKVRFKAVSDLELPRELSWSPITMRRCGIEFDNLTTTQLSQVENFLMHHTKGERTAVA